MKTEISIIMINYNGLKDTCELIESIPFNDSLEVIVVDNASQNQEADIISQKFPHVKVIKSDKNLGFAGGNNLGIKAALGRYLFLVNNDTIFKEFNIQALIHRAESSDEIGIVCPKIRFAWEPHPIQFAGYTELSKITIRNQSIGFGEEDHGQYDIPHPTPYAHGAAMFIKKEAIEKAGLMPECYFLYYEELDWSLMFKRAGYQIWYEPLFTIYHKESQATGQDSPLKTYYLTRNRFLLVKRNRKGITKYLSYIYLTTMVTLRNICKYTMTEKWTNCKATITGIVDFVSSSRSNISY